MHLVTAVNFNMMTRRQARTRGRTPKRKRRVVSTSRIRARSTPIETRTSAAMTTTTNESIYVHRFLSALGCNVTVSGLSDVVDSVLKYIKHERLEQNYNKNLFVLDSKLQKIFPFHRPFTTHSKSIIRPAVEQLLKEDARNSQFLSNYNANRRKQSKNASGLMSDPQVEPAVIVISDSSDDSNSDDSNSDESSQSDFSELINTRRRRTRSNVVISDDDDGFNSVECGRIGSLKRKKKSKISVKDDEVMFEREETLEERLERGFVQAMKNNNVIVL